MPWFSKKPRKVVHIRIFIGGPADARQERREVESIIKDAVQRRFKGAVYLEPVMWDEREAPTAFLVNEQAQAIIELEKEINTCELFIVVFKARFGKPFEHRGKLQPSGSAYELELALQAPHNHELAVFRMAEPEIKPPGRGKQEREAYNEAKEQLEKLDDFLDSLKKSGRVQNINEYTDKRDLCRQVENLLRRSIKTIAERERKAQSLRDDAGRLLLASATLPDREPTYGESPFKGLEALRYRDHEIYFGREKDLRELIGKIERRDRASFVCIHGPSGVGKSSFLMAGLIPNIIEHNMLAEGRSWKRLIFQPTQYRDPFASLATVLTEGDRRPAGLGFTALEAELRRIPELGHAEQHDAVDRLIAKPLLNGAGEAARVIAAVDQLEELFTVAARWRDDFLRLLSAISRHPQLVVYCTLRSDVLAEWNRNELLKDLLNDGIMHGLLPPTTEQLRTMVLGPANSAGVDVQAVLEALIEDAKQIGDVSLPVVAYGLDVLYAKAPGDKPSEKVLTLDQYSKLDGLRGLIGQHIRDTLASHGEAALLDADTLKGNLNTLFSELIVRENKRPSRRPVARGDLVRAGVPGELMEGLVKARVVAVTADGKDQLAHEALFEAWDALKDWLKQNSHLLETIAELEEDAVRWDERGRSPRGLKVHRERLAELRALRKGELGSGVGAKAPISPLVADYLEAAEDLQRRQELILSVKGGHIGRMLQSYEAGGRLQPEDRSDDPHGVREPFYCAVMGNWRPQEMAAERQFDSNEEVPDDPTIYNEDNANSITQRGWSVLHIAAALGHLRLARHLIAKGADPQKCSMNGATTLSSACFGGSLEMAKLLESYGVDPLAEEKDGSSALLWAVQRGNEDVIDYLHSRGADFSKSSKEGWNVLTEAVAGGHISLVERFLKEVPETTRPFASGFTPLMRCCQSAPDGWRGDRSDLPRRRLAIAELLLKAGVDPAARITSHDGTTAAHIAAEDGQIEMLRWLVQHGVDVNIRSDGDFTPLHIAVDQSSERFDVAEALLDLGANPDAVSKNGLTPLALAAARGHERIVRRLLAAGAKPNLTPENRWSPLNIAADDGHLPIVKLLLEYDADIEQEVAPGWTPLMLTMRNGHPPRERAARLLLEEGANPNVGQAVNSMPLQLALGQGCEDLALLLLQKGADPDLLSVDPYHALHTAAEKGFTRVIRQLLDRGVPVDVAASNGSTALSWALSKKQREAVEVLLEYHASTAKVHENGVSPACAAAEGGDIALMEKLAACGARFDTVSGQLQSSPLHFAATADNADACRWLLARHPDLINVADANGSTALHAAAEADRALICKLLVDAGAAVERQRKDLRTALHCAANANAESACEFLLIKPGKTLSIADAAGWTPLHGACAHGDVRLMAQMIAAGADPHAHDAPHELSPIHIAAANGRTSACEFLLTTHQAAVNARSKNGETPLLLAAHGGHHEVCKLLCASDADPAATNQQGSTPLIAASEGGHVRCIEVLAPLSSLETALSDGAHTALHRASLNNHQAAVLELVRHGASLSARDWTEDTPLHLAAETGATEVIDALLNAGADHSLVNRWGETAADMAAGFRCASSLDVFANHGVHASRVPSYRESDAIDFLLWTALPVDIETAFMARAKDHPGFAIPIAGSEIRGAEIPFLGNAWLIAAEQKTKYLAREQFAILSSDLKTLLPLDWTAPTFYSAVKELGVRVSPEDSARYVLLACNLGRANLPVIPLTDPTLVYFSGADLQLREQLSKHARPLEVVGKRGPDIITLRGNLLAGDAIVHADMLLFLAEQTTRIDDVERTFGPGTMLIENTTALVEGLTNRVRFAPRYI